MEPLTDLDMIRDWLDSKGVTLWADWTLTDPADRDIAAMWFLREYHAFQHYQNTHRATMPAKMGAYDVV
jgi:hypothetical protein